ncbi:unnamed protein product [Hymenolepis diminuta]|uniref:SH3 domain-containing protein n=1 Tax=Hymenolepis diminuta TaxID=6216 RepID=A0A0R3ST11_HYMDI|nr:unnamed protein product [Hymenolepis diminuta]
MNTSEFELIRAHFWPFTSKGSTPEVLKARAIAPFHDQNGGYQLLSFNEGDIIGVFTDSLNSKEDTGWWRGFRFANGPSGGIGMFPANRVSLFPLSHQQQQPQGTSAVQIQSNEKKGKIDFCFMVMGPGGLYELEKHEDDESETNDSSGTSQKAENSIISSGIDETPPQNGSEGLQKIDNLVPSPMPVPLRPPMVNASSNMPTEAGNMSNLLINSSNRNSATSLDSGRGSAYATSSEGLKLVSISFFLNYHKSVMPFHENVRVKLNCCFRD